jgi:hypothetical protein
MEFFNELLGFLNKITNVNKAGPVGMRALSFSLRAVRVGGKGKWRFQGHTIRSRSGFLSFEVSAVPVIKGHASSLFGMSG